MHPVHQALYYHILESAIRPYYQQTSYYQCLAEQARQEDQLCRRLTAPQREALEAVKRAASRTQDAELEAMFLAGLDCGLALTQSLPRLAQK